jgi:hypothetical protein
MLRHAVIDGVNALVDDVVTLLFSLLENAIAKEPG